MYGRSFRRNKRQSRIKKRALTLLITAILVGGIYYKLPNVFLSPAEAATIEEVATSVYSAVVQNVKLSTRDPFAVPSDFVVTAKVDVPSSGRTDATSSPNSSSNSGQQISRPLLTGVVVAANGGAAIIQYGGESQSYQKGEYVGSYRVVAIGRQTVTLQGPGGAITLRLER